MVINLEWRSLIVRVAFGVKPLYVFYLTGCEVGQPGCLTMALVHLDDSVARLGVWVKNTLPSIWDCMHKEGWCSDALNWASVFVGWGERVFGHHRTRFLWLYM